MNVRPQQSITAALLYVAPPNEVRSTPASKSALAITATLSEIS